MNDKLTLIRNLFTAGCEKYVSTGRKVDYKDKNGCTMAFEVADNYINRGESVTKKELIYINNIVKKLHSVLGDKPTLQFTMSKITDGNIKRFRENYIKLITYIKENKHE